MIATIIVLAVLALLIVLAFRSVRKKGVCNCGSCGGEGACPHCAATEKMVKDLEKQSKSR